MSISHWGIFPGWMTLSTVDMWTGGPGIWEPMCFDNWCWVNDQVA